MKKQTLFVVLACAMTLSVGSVVFAAPTATPAAETAVVQNTTGRALGMQEVSMIFSQKYNGGLIHSVSLDPSGGNFAYVVSGVSNGTEYTLNIDVLDGKIVQEEKVGKMKDIPSKVFNPKAVINEHRAEAIAVQAMGEGAVAKGWKISADKGIAVYDVTVHQNNQATTVTINAIDGTVTAKSAPVAVAAEYLN